MFVLRGIAVSLTFFWFCYCISSVVVACGWRCLERLRGFSPRFFATLLIFARILPFALSATATLLVAAPSFVLLEPRGADEDIGVRPLFLIAGCLVFIVVGLVRVIRAQIDTSHVISGWMRGARELNIGAPTPTFQVASATPPLTLAGVCRPRLLLSTSALARLTAGELAVAVRHEIAHMRSHDNLKKLTLRFAWFPGMGQLEKAWQEAAEVAADHAAVSNATQALDLADALIKLSRLVTRQPLPPISVTFVHDAVGVRVSRLLNWEKMSFRSARKFYQLMVCSAVAILMATALAYGSVLKQTHTLTEWLVR